MGERFCRIGIHRWGRVWSDDGPHLACRRCRAPATVPRVGWPFVAAVAALAGLSYLVFSVTREPNYNLARTAACLRTKGYAVSRPYPDPEWTRPRPLAITIRAGRNRGFAGPLDATFTPSADQAHKMAVALDSVPLATRRNVMFNWEGGLPQGSDPILACLQS